MALKLISKDSRYEYLSKLNEKKQAFNAYKIQRQKEEKEEQRLRQKKAKEDFENFLMRNDRINSSMKYYRLVRAKKDSCNISDKKLCCFILFQIGGYVF
jgi:hypothetical protein